MDQLKYKSFKNNSKNSTSAISDFKRKFYKRDKKKHKKHKDKYHKQNKYSKKKTKESRHSSLFSSKRRRTGRHAKKRHRTSIIQIPQTQTELFTFMDDNIEELAFTYGEALKSVRFYHICGIDLCNTFIASFLISQWKYFGTDYLEISNEEYLTILGSFTAFASGVGRLFIAYFFDWNKSFRISMGVVTITFCIFLGTISFLKDLTFLGNNTSEILFFVWLCILYACVGGGYATYASAISQTFGIKNSGMILGTLFYAEIPASIIESYLYGAIDGWMLFCIFATCIAGVSTLLAITYSTRNEKKVKFLKQNNAWQLRQNKN